MGQIIKFRDSSGESELITHYTKALGLNNESATIRILLRSGGRSIDELFRHIQIVTHPLKFSEIDFFTTALNVYLKKQKKELKEQTTEKLKDIVSQNLETEVHKPKEEDTFDA